MRIATFHAHFSYFGFMHRLRNVVYHLVQNDVICLQGIFWPYVDRTRRFFGEHGFVHSTGADELGLMVVSRIPIKGSCTVHRFDYKHYGFIIACLMVHGALGRERVFVVNTEFPLYHDRGSDMKAKLTRYVSQQLRYSHVAVAGTFHDVNMDFPDESKTRLCTVYAEFTGKSGNAARLAYHGGKMKDGLHANTIYGRGVSVSNPRQDDVHPHGYYDIVSADVHCK